MGKATHPPQEGSEGRGCAFRSRAHFTHQTAPSSGSVTLEQALECARVPPSFPSSPGPTEWLCTVVGSQSSESGSLSKDL